jgi:hypothetical protein
MSIRVKNLMKIVDLINIYSLSKQYIIIKKVTIKYLVTFSLFLLILHLQFKLIYEF